jgi:hypothetical protein
MPCVERLTTQSGLKSREIVAPASEGREVELFLEVATTALSLAPRSVREARSRGPSGRMEGVPISQGVGLRPRLWAGVSRPVGPMGRFSDRLLGQARLNP